MTENEEKKLQMIREKMAQLKAQEQAITAKEKARLRKERTCRLIQNGALAEKYLKSEGTQPHDFEKVLKAVVSQLNEK